MARFMRELGRHAPEPADVYFTAGVPAILHRWRDTTIDLDTKIVPDRKDLLRMMDAKLVDPDRLLGLLEQIEPNLHPYPAVDPASFRRAAELALQID